MPPRAAVLLNMVSLSLIACRCFDAFLVLIVIAFLFLIVHAISISDE